MNKFNLGRALAGDKVVTRSGLDIISIKIDPSKKDKFDIKAMDDRNITKFYDREGLWKMMQTSCYDLVMKEPESIYTKEMRNSGWPPLVGMKCMVYVDVNEGVDIKEWFSAVVVGKYKELPIIRLDDYDDVEGYFDVFNLDNIKPIDTRTDKEKAIDDINTYIQDKQGLVMAKTIFEYIESGKFHGVSFVGKG